MQDGKIPLTEKLTCMLKSMSNIELNKIKGSEKAMYTDSKRTSRNMICAVFRGNFSFLRS